MIRYIIIITILISLFACAGPRADSAGIINSQRISQTDFIRSYQGHTANFQMANQRIPNADEKRAIFQDTWKNITTHVILKDYFKRYQISVNEQEVIDTLMSTIPDYFKSNPTLQINGKFDPELYYQSLRYDSPINMSPIRRNYYEYYVPVQKLKSKLIDEDLKDRKKVKSIAEIAVSKADFDLLVFDPAEMEPILSDSEIEAYYQRHLEHFAMDPIFSIEYLIIPVNPLEEDFNYTRAVTDSIFEQVMAGKSLDTVVLERSAQLPGITLSEPGFVRIENIDENILPVLEALPDKAHSRPIQIGRAFGIYQKLQRTKSMLSYRVLLIPPILSPATINSHYNNALGTISLALKLGTMTAAEELDLELHTLNGLKLTDLWYSDKLIVDTVNKHLAVRKRGDFLEPIFSPVTGSWLVVKLTENKVNRVSPLAEVKHIIVQELMETRRQRLAEQKAGEWLKENPSLTTVSGRDNFKPFSNAGIDSQYQGLALDMIYLDSFSRHQLKQAPQVHKLANLHVILIPRAYHPQKNLKADEATIRRLYTRQLDPDWFDTWMQNKRKKSRVQIFVNP